MKEWKGTKGEWISRIQYSDGGLVSTKECDIVTVHGYGNLTEEKANAVLIADTGNTIQKCGLMPSELLMLVEYYKQKSKLLEIIDSESPCDPDITEGQIKAYANYQNFLKTNELINKITE